MANPTNNPRLFEVNLIGDQVSKFFRRRTFQKWCTVGAVVMLLIALVMAVRIVMNVSKALAVNSGIRADKLQIQKDEEDLASLDKLKQDVLDHIKKVASLVPIADARVSWAPKLAALAGAFPPGTTLMNFRGSEGDLFNAWATVHPTAEAQNAGVKINFAVGYAPSADTEKYPVTFVKKLRDSKDFLFHVDNVGLDSLEQDSEQGKPLVILRGSAEGARPN